MVRVEDKTMLKSLVGTPQYLAPEVVMQTKELPGYENVVDSWSVGIIVYSMLTKNLPFDDNSQLSLEQRIRARAHMDFDRTELHRNNVSPAAIDFIERLLEPDPTKRMTMKDAVLHEWLAGPSSLPDESLSQSQPLYGTSMWNIQAFESDAATSDGEDVDMDDAATRANWSRPPTMSATNFDSASGMDAGSSSSESFSQPMENLRLSTAKVNQLSPPREETTASPPPAQNGHAERARDDTTPRPQTGSPVPPSANGTSAMEVDTSGVTIGAKRKLPARSGMGDGFSSGELTPPPSSLEAARKTRGAKKATPAKKSPPKTSPPKKTSPANANGAKGRGDRETTPRADPVLGGGRVTRAATARLTAGQGSPASRTRSHAVRDGEVRGTKSRRVG